MRPSAPRLLLLLVLAASAARAEDPRQEEFSGLVETIRETYGVAVRFENQDYPVKCSTYEIRAENPEREEVLAYAGTLREFTLYPKGLVKKSGIREVVLARKIVFKDARYEQARAAVPAFERDALYLDVTGGGAEARDRAHILHHEFFHAVDWKDDGELYGDAKWSKLNAESFRYGNGGAELRDDDAGVLTDKFPGFLTRYARSGVEEDKAETFSWLVVEPETVLKRAKKDKVLGKKVEALKKLLVEAAKDVDEGWWKGIREVRKKEAEGK